MVRCLLLAHQMCMGEPLLRLPIQPLPREALVTAGSFASPPWWPVACPRCAVKTGTQAELQAHLQGRHGLERADAVTESVTTINSAEEAQATAGSSFLGTLLAAQRGSEPMLMRAEQKGDTYTVEIKAAGELD